MLRKMFSLRQVMLYSTAQTQDVELHCRLQLLEGSTSHKSPVQLHGQDTPICTCPAITCSPAADLHHCLVCAEQRGHVCTGKRPTFINSVTARQAPRWSKALTHPGRASSKASTLDSKASKTHPSQALGTSPDFCLSISAPAIFACSWSCATRSLLRPSPLRSSAAASLQKLSSSS